MKQQNEVFVGYRITGILHYSTTRFKALNREKLQDALNINLWNGSIWGIRKDGSKKLIKRVIN